MEIPSSQNLFVDSVQQQSKFWKQFTGKYKIILKLQWNHKTAWTDKSIVCTFDKNNAWGIITADFKLYCRVMVIKNIMFMVKNKKSRHRLMEQNRRTKHECTYIQTIGFQQKRQK